MSDPLQRSNNTLFVTEETSRKGRPVPTNKFYFTVYGRPDLPPDEVLAYAERVQTAVNLHDELVEACRLFRRYDDCDPGHVNSDQTNAYEEARDAILGALAKVEPKKTEQE